jgi:hypothetical protein
MCFQILRLHLNLELALSGLRTMAMAVGMIETVGYPTSNVATPC